MKTKTKKLLFVILCILIVVLGTVVIANAAAELEKVTDTTGMAFKTMQVGKPVEKKIIKPYQFTSSGYNAITEFPIDRDVFNSSADHFCAQHGTPYGGAKNGSFGSSYHQEYTVTKNKVSGKTSDPKGDIDTSADFYLNASGNLVSSSKTYQGWRDSSETPSATTFTNWVYLTQGVSFDCEGMSSGRCASSRITDGAMAFLLACYKGNRAGGYQNDPLQWAVWEWLGQADHSPLDAAAEAFKKYHEASKDPNIDIFPASNVGTVLEGTKYKVGPFKMSDYVTASRYDCSIVYKEKQTYDPDADGIVYYEDYDIDINESGIDLQQVFGNEHIGSIIKAEAIVTNGSGDTKSIQFPVPSPNEVFYIKFDEADLEGYDELLDIVFTYQRIHASANGTFYIGKQQVITWSQKSSKKGCSTYYNRCKSTYHNNTANSYKFGRTPTERNSGGQQNCTHYWYNRRYKICKGHKQADGSIKYCDNLNTCTNWKYGYTDYHNDYTHKALFTCTHEHEDCKYFTWQWSAGGDVAQDGFAGSGVLVNEQITYRIRVSVPLKTQMAIYKYIEKVDHYNESTGEYDLNLYNLGTARREMTMDEKDEDTVKVERGDLVTYKIEAVNDSRFPVRVKIRETYPMWSIKAYAPTEIDNEEWITIDANSVKEFTVQVYADRKSGIDRNIVEFITTNYTDPHMQCTEWDNDATHGPNKNSSIVNTYTKEKDSDTHETKEYNISLDKCIVKAEHVGDGTVYYEGTDRKNRDDEISKNMSPVYVEYGDRITYEIDIFNTTEPYEHKREERPYWNPDLVYVSVEESLPQNYSDLQITVDNGSGIVGEVDNGKVRIDEVMVPANGKTTITVSLVVEEHDRFKMESNEARFVGPRLNINKKEIEDYPSKTNSYDYYHLNDYDLSINKYVCEYNYEMTKTNNKAGYTTETVVAGTKDTDEQRAGLTEQEKMDYPVPVEKTDTLVYALKLTNNAVETTRMLPSSIKYATAIRPTDVTDVLDDGLSYQSVYAKVWTQAGEDKYGDLPITVSALGNNTYRFTLANNTEDGRIILVDPGEYIQYYVTVKVTKTNMYLYSLSNMGIITTLTNINHTDDTTRIIKNDEYNENIATSQISTEYVKLKDLVISGKVWLDADRDGYMGKGANGKLTGYATIDNLSVPSERESGDTPDDQSEYALKNIVVKLYSVDGETSTLVRTTKTDSKGLFTFGRDKNYNWYSGTYKVYGEDKTHQESEQRIPKATNKDSKLNYTSSSEYIGYYIEYEYDGVLYKSTEVYSGTKNIANDGALVSGNKYKIDSNAKEFTNVRNNFDKKYEIVGYNKAYNGNLTQEQQLEYAKNNHKSSLLGKSSRVMTSRSFIIDTDAETLKKNCEIAMNKCGAAQWKQCVNHWKNWQGLIDSGYFNPNEYPNTTAGRLKAQADLKQLYNEVIGNLTESGITQITRNLWLFKPAVETDKPETDYLKYINLGLVEREKVDIELVQDVYEVKTTINGDETTYKYNQNKYALDGSAVDPAGNGSSENYESKFYMTRKKADSNNDAANLSAYVFKYSKTDYNYRYDDYNIETVRNYKTKDSELNSEISFRIKVTNTSITNDEPYATTKDIKVYTGINEIIEYFDKNFANIEYNSDGTVKTINVKTENRDGYLVDTPYKIADAYFVLPNGTKIPARMEGRNTINNPKVLTNASMYNTDAESQQIKNTVETYGGYNTVYIRPNVDGINKVILEEGQNVDVIIKFTVDKPNRNSDNQADRALKIGLKTALAEIGAYSTYYKNIATGNYYAAGLVDRDSNPGNFGVTYDGNSLERYGFGENYFKYIEDDTYRTGIKDIPTEDSVDRRITGLVWDDARSEVVTKANGDNTEDGAQYVGDGKYGEGISNTDEYGKRPEMNDSIMENRLPKEYHDFLVDDVKVELFELVRTPYRDDAGNFIEERIYEEPAKNSDKHVINTRTGKGSVGEGKYILEGFIPGEYIVRFTYGDTSSEQMILFNGQDYKSTTYQAGSEYVEDKYNFKADGRLEINDATAKAVREIIEKPGLSDAKDDEIRRLEVISYSETINNNIETIINGSTSENVDIQRNKTKMYADTAEFTVATEQQVDKHTYSFAETMAFLNASLRQEVRNVDFGLQYRPEQQVLLNQYIKNITVTTSNSNTGEKEKLVDAKFSKYYGLVVSTDIDSGITNFLSYENPNSTTGETIIHIPSQYITGNAEDIENYINNKVNEKGWVLTRDLQYCKKNQDGTYQIALAGTQLDKANSIGLDNLQYIENSADFHLTTSQQGFVYINVDSEIMQGAEINVEYLYEGNNISEIDRVNKNLSVLRYKANTETLSYAVGAGEFNAVKLDALRAGGTVGSISFITKKDEFGYDKNYSGALTARNELFNSYYHYEVTSTDPNTAEPVRDKTGSAVIYRVKPKTIYRGITETDDSKSAYYGKYLGAAYYTGKAGLDDVVAQLKINKILNYVDNDFVFRQEQNDANTANNYWMSYTPAELGLNGYISLHRIEQAINAEKYTAIYLRPEFTGFKETLQKINDEDKIEAYLEDQNYGNQQETMSLLREGYLEDSNGIAYSTNERSNLVVSQDVRKKDNQNNIPNAKFTKYLSPRDGKDENSHGEISIILSKVISAEEDASSLSFDNVGEIIEFNSVTGRRLSKATTVGNVDVSQPSDTTNSPEYQLSMYRGGYKESDTAAVERVTLTPPTGLTKTEQIIKTAIKGVSYVGIVVIIIAIGIFGTFGGIKLYRKRKIK